MRISWWGGCGRGAMYGSVEGRCVDAGEGTESVGENGTHFGMQCDRAPRSARPAQDELFHRDCPPSISHPAHAPARRPSDVNCARKHTSLLRAK